MTINEVIPIITPLSRADKLKLMQIILTQIVQEEDECSDSKEIDPQLDAIWAKEADARVEAYKRGEIEKFSANDVFAKYYQP